MIKRIDRYVLWQAVRPIAAIIGIGLVILSLARFLIVFGISIGNDQAFVLTLQLIAFFVPHYLGFMLPFALYWSSYQITHRMHVNAEAAAFQTAGQSLTRLSAPLIALGVGLTAVNLAVTGWLEPIGRYSYRALIDRLEKTEFYLKARHETFLHRAGRTIYIDRILDDRKTFRDILIFEERQDGVRITMTAQSGTLVTTPSATAIRLSNGQRLETSATDASQIQYLNFSILDIPLEKSIKPFRPRGDDELELSLLDLYRLQESPPPGATRGDMKAELHRKWVIVLSSLFLPMLGIVLAHGNSSRKKTYYTAAALLVVLLYHQLVEFSAGLVETRGVSPYISLWPVFLVFASISLLLFAATGRTREPPVTRLISGLSQLAGLAVNMQRSHARG